MVLGIAMLMSACTTPQPTPPQSLPPPNELLELSPVLSHYGNFELSSNTTSTKQPQKLTGNISFSSDSVSFVVSENPDRVIGRLFVQPEVCRDDPSSDCMRHYVISGKILALDADLHCYIPIRNDTLTGYVGQSLTGICQDPYGRSFSITLFGS